MRVSAWDLKHSLGSLEEAKSWNGEQLLRNILTELAIFVGTPNIKLSPFLLISECVLSWRGPISARLNRLQRLQHLTPLHFIFRRLSQRLLSYFLLLLHLLSTLKLYQTLVYPCRSIRRRHLPSCLALVLVSHARIQTCIYCQIGVILGLPASSL